MEDMMIELDGNKLSCHKDRVDALLRGDRVAPITIDCALTRSCSYRCVYCYGALQENDRRTIDKDTAFSFLDDAAEIGVKAISFVSDGESTCSPHLYDAITHGRANGLDMALGTNGYLLKDDRLDEILPALTYLRFNISAAYPRRYSEIHGCAEDCYYKVISTIRECVRIKKQRTLSVTIGLQMVLLPELCDQVLPLAKLGKELGVDYIIIKHCSDDELGSLGVDYAKYHDLIDVLKEAEKRSTESYAVRAKWSKILSGGTRSYSRCYGPPLIMQLSGSGLVAPCGMLFNERYKRYHIGNITETPFKEIWKSERYWDVMGLIASPQFDARTMCGSLCLQHSVNTTLWLMKNNPEYTLKEPEDIVHRNFI